VILEKERLTSIGGLAIRLAHDIRNPLSVIQNGFEIIKIKTKNTVDDNINSNFDSIKRSISRITHQIDDVLNFVNISNLQYEKHSLLSLIKSTISDTIIPDNVKVILPEHDCDILCDPYKLDIVFKNLIDNACYAINGIGEITIRINDAQNDVIIEIEDSGTGIPDSVIRKVFEPLFTTKQIGTGLGLASCKSIIDAHDGEISVRNNPTIFTIRLPKNSQKIQESIKNEPSEPSLERIPSS